MAKCEIKLPDELINMIKTLGEKTDEILTSTLEAGGKVVLQAAKANLNRAVKNTSDRSTGELQKSIGLSPVDVNRKGEHNIKVGFAEPRRDSESGGKYPKTNAMVANILEYGRKGKQAARPFIRPAKVSSKAAAERAMEDKWSSEIDKLGVK